MALLGVGEAPGFLGSSLLAVGSFHDALGIYTGGAHRPCTPENMAQFGGPKVEFVKKFPKTFNTDYWPQLMQGALDKAGLTFADVDHYYFTQLNLRTIEAMMALDRPADRENTLGHGQMGLHRLALRGDGAGRRDCSGEGAKTR